MAEGARAPRLRIRAIHAKTDSAFRSAYRLLTRIFPRAEMLPRTAWEHVLKERDAGVWTDLNWHLLVAEYDGKVVGAATGSYLGNVEVGLIGYIAVDKAARSFGVGPRLRWGLRLAFERDARWLGRRPLKAIVGEVRRDNPWLRSLVGRGAIALDFPYYQPSLRRRGKAVPLVLYYQALGVSRISLPATEVRRLLYTIWRRAYRVPQPLSSPNFRKMLRALTGQSRIGQLRLVPPP